ncbi:MAG TPA: nuclear transport factor 2 family protein [Candidatus Stackebrandtia excrementipullorum]|nr:nuclear transport factor 2 family protein [Candidatus Stackebrandtia excrementipullorum]
MVDFTKIAAGYIETFNETDAVRRKQLIDNLFATDVTYVDPRAAIEGQENLDAMIAGVHTEFPDWSFELTGTVDGHHDQARFTWSLGPAGEEPPVLGFDVVNLDAHGAITAVHGFFDRIPTA